MKRKIKIGNDGYGGKNVTVTKTSYGIEIIQTDPHDWNRVSGRVGIRNDDLKSLIEFINQYSK